MKWPLRVGAVSLLTACLSTCGWFATVRGRVVVLGVDGLHLPLLDELVSKGELPNFARLYREGTVGGVSTLPAGLPPVSARVWTSFATGVLPDEHGVLGFVHDDPKEGRRLASSQDRRSATIWEIASAAGKRVGLVNWLVSYPAEPLHGFNVTERYLPLSSQLLARWQRATFDRDAQRVVYPPALARTLLDLPLRPQHPTANSPAVAEDNDANVLTMTYAALRQYPVDLLMVYTRSVDELSHLWWLRHEPRAGDPPGPDLVVEYYHSYDRLLGEFMAQLSPQDRLLLLSDHGMERNPGAGLSGNHASERVAVGVQIWWGRDIPAGKRLSSSLLDVAPTLLEMLDIPPSEAMKGKVLSEVLPPGHALLPRRREPYPRPPIESGVANTTEADPEILRRLKTLGYINN